MTELSRQGVRQRVQRSYKFGPFRIDPEERVLRRGEEVIPLTPKAVETLLVLASSAGRVVDKEELLKRVWPDTFVEEGGLARNISLLRKVLGPGPGDAEYIETIPRRGYRFAASVLEPDDNGPTLRSLAVLPLANLSGDPDQDFFADGMTDEIISQFMRIEALRVSSRTSVMAYKSAGKSLRHIARELDVDCVVEGTVCPSGGRVRIAARLIDGATEKNLWAATYEKNIEDVLALQNEVARDIAGEIRVKMSSPEKARLAASRAVDPEAYKDYLRGRYFLNKRTGEGLKKARDYFRQAIEQDPTYGPAHSGLADAYALMGSAGYDIMPPREAMPLAKAAARNALSIDETLAEAHAALGYVTLVYEWDASAAERELARAMELNPSYAPTYQWLGELLMARAQHAEAEKAFARALELDPLSIPCNLGLGWCYYFGRDYDRAIAQYIRTLEIAPSVPMALYGLGLAYSQKRLPLEGLSEFRKAEANPGSEPAATMLAGVAHAMANQRQAARRCLASLQDLSQKKYVPAVYSAFIHIALENLDEAFEWLEKACEERSSYLIFLKVQPALERVRADPRYDLLLERAGLP